MDVGQQIAAAFGVLALLGGALFYLRLKGMAAFSLPGAARTARRLRVVERLPISPGTWLVLVQVDGEIVLIAASPAGCQLLPRTVPGGAQ